MRNLVLRDLVLPTAEFAYNNSVNKSTAKSPFEVVNGVIPRPPIDLVPFPIDSRHAEFAKTFAKHIHGVHVDVQ